MGADLPPCLLDDCSDFSSWWCLSPCSPHCLPCGIVLHPRSLAPSARAHADEEGSKPRADRHVDIGPPVLELRRQQVRLNHTGELLGLLCSLQTPELLPYSRPYPSFLLINPYVVQQAALLALLQHVSTVRHTVCLLLITQCHPRLDPHTLTKPWLTLLHQVPQVDDTALMHLAHPVHKFIQRVCISFGSEVPTYNFSYARI
mmetsp:Transcript_24802/g.62953  ORF Transcript_24802/g.62953 Transcript_24802/m.62953 type:complete len:202 (+) Transcript_24802:327-932(+)